MFLNMLSVSRLPFDFSSIRATGLRAIWGKLPVYTFGVLIVLDLLFVLLHVFVVANEKRLFYLDFAISIEMRDFLSLTRDQSLSEYWEYSKSVVTAALYLMVYAVSRHLVFAVFSMLFLFIALDNGFSIHENAFAFIGGPVAADLLSFIVIGGVFSLALYASWPRRNILAKHGARGALSTAVILAAFAVIVDALSGIVGKVVPKTYALFGLVEDGGELVALSLALSYALALFLICRTRDPQYFRSREIGE